MKLMILLMLFAHFLFAQSEVKEIKVFNIDAIGDFCGAREYEVYKVLRTLKYPPKKDDDNTSELIYLAGAMLHKEDFRTYKGKGFSTEYISRGENEKILITSIHFDASAIHPEDRDKKKLLKRFGIDSNEKADALKMQLDETTLQLNFDGNRLKSVDIEIYIN
ncbi:hypothetical protein [Sulfurospirillum oryzae]|uniref:hypothetical protein n=1 Tax=Sulfurospirillum oryzae TaxID=2976535 RepID=UPI0021E705E9|nr:hypothetical protein [Sulfurospirillum oryzae]